MPRGRQIVLGHAVTAPPVRDGPDGIADSSRHRPPPVAYTIEVTAAKRSLVSA
jgi:hypothetical protein